MRPVVPPTPSYRSAGSNPLRGFFRIVIWVLVINLAAATAASIFAPREFPWELLAHFQHYMAAAGVVIVVLALLFRFFLAILASLAAIAALAHAVFAPLMDTAPGTLFAEASSARVIWANVLGQPDALRRTLDMAASENAQLAMITEVPRDVDLATFSETFTCVDEPEIIDTFAVVIFAPPPCVDGSAPSFGAGANAVRAKRLESGASAIEVVATHPAPPITPHYLTRRDELIRTAVTVADNTPGPVLLIGDFNATPWSDVMAQIGRRGLNLVDCGAPFTPTWSPLYTSPLGRYIGLPIDSAYVSEGVTAACRVGPDVGSDHRPLIVDVSSAS